MPRLSDAFLSDLMMRCDIVDLVSSYVTLKKRGNTYVGLCPFHNEKTPSFTVYPDTNSFYCFGCGAAGDVVNFVKKIDNLDYLDAIKALAQRAGLQMPEDGYDDSLSKRRKKILEINKETARFYHSYMMSEKGKAGLNYYLNRGLSLKTITHFGLGYAPNEWSALLDHLKSKGFSISDMEAAKVIKKGNHGYYDIFRNRVMTPIIDVRGNVIAFGGRVLDNSKPKYINSTETMVYKKTNELFGLNFAKDSGEESIILCEGYMDVISMHQAGFTNAVAGCGTALTPEQARVISRYANEVVLVYDNDEAGQKALNRAISIFSQIDIKIRVPKLEGGKDPDEIIRTYGKARFASILDTASNETEFALVSARSKYDLSTTMGKGGYANEAVRILCGTNPIERDLYLSRLSEELGIEKRALEAQLNEYKKRKDRNFKKHEYEKIINDNANLIAKESYDTKASSVMIKAQQRIIGLLLTHPDCVKLCDDFDTNMFTDGFYKKAIETIIERLKSDMSVDLIVFNETFSDDEMSKITRIMHQTQNSGNIKKEFTDCLNVVKSEYQKANSPDVSQLDDDAFRNMFKKDNT
ncbi:MAG TPA: DNA primase [Ruminococcaceae bacterium]|nr:DNA primase [Oscillospiraceae bacterium]